MTAALMRLSVTCWLIAVTAVTVVAHDGPDEVIARLNVELLRSGPSADLLFRRACEFRALRRYERAAADLQHALKLDASLDSARLELARLQLWALEHPTESELGSPMQTLEPLTSHSDLDLRTAALALRGKTQLITRNYSAAAEDFTTALLSRPDLEWYLARAETQQKLGQLSLAVAGLQEGLAATASPVLRSALCELLIDAAAVAGHTDSSEFLLDARTIVETELSDSRFRSAWLIRRARLSLVDAKADCAKEDLAEALRELETRLTTQRPDPQLIEQREQARRLLISANLVLAENSTSPPVEQERTRTR